MRAGASISGLALIGAAALPVTEPEDWVAVLAGSSGGQTGGTHHSSGNTLPLVARPWGFNHWAPQTTNELTSWWFDADADTFRGVRCTHQPSPWIGDYGWFLLRPFLGDGSDDWLGYTSYRASGALRPYALDITTGPFGVRVQLAPTEHAAVLRVTFPASVPPASRRICAWVPRGNGKDDSDEKRSQASGKPTGQCQANAGGIDLVSRKFADGVPDGADFAFHARLEGGGLTTEELAEIDWCLEYKVRYVKSDGKLDMEGQKPTKEATASGCMARCARVQGCSHFTWKSADHVCHVLDEPTRMDKPKGVVSGPPRCDPIPASRECCFVLGEQTQADIRIGTSFISAVQSVRALDSEVGGRMLEDVVAEGRAAWREKLLRIEVKDVGPPTRETSHRLQIFYTCLYRSLLFPRQLREQTPEGMRHWSPYSGQVADGNGVTDNGFWDTFRTVYPLLALAYPSELGEILHGWLGAFRHGGWLPKWASPGYRGSMVGTFADVVLADAILKGIGGFDVQAAWLAIHKDAYEASGPKDTTRGKHGLDQYKANGFIPIDAGVPEACSRTLDFAYADAAASVVAEKLGYAENASKLQARSLGALRALFHNDTRLMSRRKQHGWKSEPSNTWGDCFTEGSPWHHSFPPFNITALAEVYGGQDQLTARLWDMLAEPSYFLPGTYKVEIHEMREMRMLAMGQYAHNNQPTHHVLYLFSMLGDHNATAQLVRQAMARAYSVDGFVGDEDNGEMGAWFVLSALGLYAAATGTTDEYVLGAVPLFPKIVLRELDVTIEAPSAAEESPAVSEVLWHSKPIAATSVHYADLRKGGVLRWVSPGNAQSGVLLSRLRGSLHEAMRRVRQAAARREVAAREGLDKAGAPSQGSMNFRHSIAVLLVAFVLCLLACPAACKRCCPGSPADHAD